MSSLHRPVSIPPPCVLFVDDDPDTREIASIQLVSAGFEVVTGSSCGLDPARTNAYRAELGQPPISARTDRYDSPAAYCQNMVNIQTPFLAANQDVLAAAPSPAPAAGSSLLTYLASRLSSAFGHLGCRQFGLTIPVTLVRDAAGTARSATFDTTPQRATARGGG